MREDTARAQKIMLEHGNTCVFIKDGKEVYSSKKRGIKPLVEAYESGLECFGICAADKIVGRAAAFMYVLLGAKEVFAEVMSTGAKSVLKAAGIDFYSDVSAKEIRNRDNTGLCPMETAVLKTDEPEAALAAIKAKLSELQNKA